MNFILLGLLLSVQILRTSSFYSSSSLQHHLFKRQEQTPSAFAFVEKRLWEDGSVKPLTYLFANSEDGDNVSSGDGDKARAVEGGSRTSNSDLTENQRRAALNLPPLKKDEESTRSEGKKGLTE